LAFKTSARVEWRALVCGVSAELATATLVGASYWAGGLAAQADAHQRVSRIVLQSGGSLNERDLTLAVSAIPVSGRSRALQYDGVVDVTERTQQYQEARLAVRLAEYQARTDFRVETRAEVAGPAQVIRAAYTPDLESQQSLRGSARQVECLTQAVYFEARGESAVGQEAVAEVVLNRVRSPGFPKTVCGVVFQGAGTGRACQFSFACDGSMRRTREVAAWNRAERVASRALAGQLDAHVGGATHFHTANVRPGWGDRMLQVATVGFHSFYRAGSPEKRQALLSQPGRFVRMSAESAFDDARAKVAGPATALDPEPQSPAAAPSSLTHAVVDAEAVLAVVPSSAGGAPWSHMRSD